MTEIECKALALVNEVFKERGLTLDGSTNRTSNSYHEAICRAIERIEELEAAERHCRERDYAKPLMELQAEFEAFRREVSDAVETILNCTNVNKRYGACLALNRFILPKPKPDPLVEAWLEAFPGNHIDDAREECAKISAALAARGLEVRKIGEGE